MSKKAFERFVVVQGPVEIGADMELQITADQAKPRGHSVTVIEPAQKEGGDVVVRAARSPLQFKTGEVIGMRELPKYLEGKVQTEAEVQKKGESAASKSDSKKSGSGGAEGKFTKKSDEK